MVISFEVFSKIPEGPAIIVFDFANWPIKTVDLHNYSGLCQVCVLTIVRCLLCLFAALGY